MVKTAAHCCPGRTHVPSWKSLIAAGCAAAGRPNTPAFLRGVWQALEARPVGDGQLRLPLGESVDDRRDLIKALLADGSA